MSILTHEYALCLYGIILWEFSEYLQSKTPFKVFVKQSSKDILNSLLWCALVLVVDDELLAQYNKLAIIDFKSIPWQMYIMIGFFIDIIRAKYVKKDT